MTSEEFRSWRLELGLTQEAAGQKLDFSRATIISWESGAREIPAVVEQACQYLRRQWKQRPEHGPVTLCYADGPMWMNPYGRNRVPMLQMERYASNNDAIGRACELFASQSFYNPFITEEGGDVLWNGVELRTECDKRSEKSRRRRL